MSLCQMTQAHVLLCFQHGYAPLAVRGRTFATAALPTEMFVGTTRGAGTPTVAIGTILACTFDRCASCATRLLLPSGVRDCSRCCYSTRCGRHGINLTYRGKVANIQRVCGSSSKKLRAIPPAVSPTSSELAPKVSKNS